MGRAPRLRDNGRSFCCRATRRMLRALVTVAPVTTRVRGIPTEVVLGRRDGLPKNGAANLDSITTIPKEVLSTCITALEPAKPSPSIERCDSRSVLYDDVRRIVQLTNLAIDPDLLERAVTVSGERSKTAAVTRALKEFVARREQRRLVDLFGRLEWDPGYDHKRERSRS